MFLLSYHEDIAKEGDPRIEINFDANGDILARLRKEDKKIGDAKHQIDLIKELYDWSKDAVHAGSLINYRSIIYFYKFPKNVYNHYAWSYELVNYIALSIFDTSSYLRSYKELEDDQDSIKCIPFLKAAALVAHETSRNINYYFNKNGYDALKFIFSKISNITGIELGQYLIAHKILIKKAAMIRQKTKRLRDNLIGHRDININKYTHIELGLNDKSLLKLICDFEYVLFYYCYLIIYVGLLSSKIIYEGQNILKYDNMLLLKKEVLKIKEHIKIIMKYGNNNRWIAKLNIRKMEQNSFQQYELFNKV
jgi:hypothetical protein